MDGRIICLEGTGGSGKTLHALEMFDRWAKRGARFATNVALTHQFCERRWPKVPIMKLTHEETRKFWEVVPEGTHILIDEAMLVFNSVDSLALRKNEKDATGNSGFESYFAQFRKDGDTVVFMAQSFDDMATYIRRRCHEVWKCKKLAWPEWVPYLGGRPIFFGYRRFAVLNGQRGNVLGWPKIFPALMMEHMYLWFNSLEKVDSASTRKGWDDVLIDSKGERVEAPIGRKIGRGIRGWFFMLTWPWVAIAFLSYGYHLASDMLKPARVEVREKVVTFKPDATKFGPYAPMVVYKDRPVSAPVGGSASTRPAVRVTKVGEKVFLEGVEVPAEGRIHYERVDDEGVSIVGPNGSYRVPWSGIGLQLLRGPATQRSGDKGPGVGSGGHEVRDFGPSGRPDNPAVATRPSGDSAPEPGGPR